MPQIFTTESSLASTPVSIAEVQVERVARWDQLRALAWDGNILYASRGYELLRAEFAAECSPAEAAWDTVACFRSGWLRQLSSRTRLASRLFRDGFHAIAVLPNEAIVAAVPGAIVTLSQGGNEFRVTHHVRRGTRPLHITAAPHRLLYWGEYFDNPARAEVHIYGSSDDGESWNVVHTFSKGSIRHVHNIVHDPWGKCLWVLTGDCGDECRILRASYDFSHMETVLKGNQQARAVAAVPTEHGIYFSSDTPLETNHIYFLDRAGNLSKLAMLSGSSIYGCRVGSSIFFSTMVEPSRTNPDQSVRIYCGRMARAQSENWLPILAWKKDFWPMRFFQYGNAFLPDGNNRTRFLAVSTIAVQSDDMATSLYAVHP